VLLRWRTGVIFLIIVPSALFVFGQTDYEERASIKYNVVEWGTLAAKGRSAYNYVMASRNGLGQGFLGEEHR
jgi:hypothetical protein